MPKPSTAPKAKQAKINPDDRKRGVSRLWVKWKNNPKAQVYYSTVLQDKLGAFTILNRNIIEKNNKIDQVEVAHFYQNGLRVAELTSHKGHWVKL